MGARNADGNNVRVYTGPPLCGVRKGQVGDVQIVGLVRPRLRPGVIRPNGVAPEAEADKGGYGAGGPRRSTICRPCLGQQRNTAAASNSGGCTERVRLKLDSRRRGLHAKRHSIIRISGKLHRGGKDERCVALGATCSHSTHGMRRVEWRRRECHGAYDRPHLDEEVDDIRTTGCGVDRTVKAGKRKARRSRHEGVTELVRRPETRAPRCRSACWRRNA